MFISKNIFFLNITINSVSSVIHCRYSAGTLKRQGKAANGAFTSALCKFLEKHFKNVFCFFIFQFFYAFVSFSK